ncbi:MAG: hypothetical protein JO370_00710, partial [Paucibacter sp.]|nr:hypothetical protein [Roseateles sp.]
MRKFTLSMLAAVAFTLAAGAAKADIVSYQVSNATFNDGIVMSGTWSFNTATDQVTAMNLAFTNSPYAQFVVTGPIGAHVSQGNGPNAWEVSVWGSPGPNGYVGDNYLHMNFDFNATTGAPIVSNNNNAYYTSMKYDNPSLVPNPPIVLLSSPGTYSVTGGVQPVPEPASAALML